MALLIDRPAWWWQGRLWSHLVSDVSLDELHLFARQAGLRYISFGRDHYDVPEELFDHVVDLGAAVSDSRDLVRRLRAAGLRERQGKAARTWARRRVDVAALDQPQRSDLIATAAEFGCDADQAWVFERPETTVVTLIGATSEQQPMPSTVTRSGARRVITSEGDRLVIESIYGVF